jgi:Flp pilus assembly protein TadD
MTAFSTWSAAWKSCFTAITGLLLCSCATVSVQAPPVPPLLNQPQYAVDDIDPLELSGEMKQWVKAQVLERDNNESRAWLLAYAMLTPYVLDFTYDPRVTLTAKEAFRARHGNCLTFSNLFVALAREAGLDAWYREVEILPEWSSVDDTLLVNKHVNAATQDRGNEYVIDVSRRKEVQDQRHRRLSDREARAQLYNNLGADALIAGDLPMAYAYFRKSLETVPDLDYVWSNLGVVFNRNGQTRDAILAYETVLRLKPGQTVALNNLFSIYEEAGDLARAEQLRARVERNRQRNPYFLDYLAEAAMEEGRWDDAISLARKAIRLDESEYRFHFTLARAQFRAGNTRIAETSLRQAQRLAPPDVSQSDLTLPGEG